MNDFSKSEQFTSITIRSWREDPDENNTSWWCAQHTIVFPSGNSAIGPLFKSRHSRQRAESYVLHEWADQLAKMSPLTTVVD